MTSVSGHQTKARRGLGLYLMLILAGVMGFYLLTTWHSIQALREQSREFSNLSGTHFERTMTAAELSRDAEVIAAQALESLLGTRRTTSDISALDNSLLQIYQNIRQQLIANDEQEQQELDKLDRWQQPYFDSLQQLESKLQQEQGHLQQQQQQLNQLIQEIQTLEQRLLNADAQPSLFNSYALAALSYSAAALNTERRGQLSHLEQRTQTLLDTLSKESGLNSTQQNILNRLKQLSQSIFKNAQQTLVSQRVSLASARETRLYAQKLAASSYNYFLTLQQNARDAARIHQRLVTETQKMIGLFSVIFIVLVVLGVLYVREKIIKRLDHLHQVMMSHVAGYTPKIPTEGNDEISAMGEAFEVFVTARQRAEQELISARLEAEQANEQLKQLNQQLQILSETDTLTQVANRRRFEQAFDHYWQKGIEQRTKLCLIIIDIDKFKDYNDHYGHHAGDHCLIKVAQTLNKTMQQYNGILARFGGEEFVALLPNMDSQQGQPIAEQLLQATRAAQIPHEQSPEGIVTISLGIASCQPDNNSQPFDLLQKADKALYQAKHNGRARAEIA